MLDPEPDDGFWAFGLYQASFGVERDGHRFVVSVWFEKTACPMVDLVRFAMDRLHLVLVHLARQTGAWRLDQMPVQ